MRICTGLNNDSRLRDYTFSDQLNGFLVTNSQENHLLLYGQNQYLVGDGIFEFYAIMVLMVSESGRNHC